MTMHGKKNRFAKKLKIKKKLDQKEDYDII